MAAHTKGTVTSLSSIFPAEEARRASQRVQEKIADKHKELDRLHHFVADNDNLINLVQRLPDELHHQIMVPFGKAAFFPGSLVHTNEFMVLLGEGYYAERTAKQTVDILKRRGKTLESQVDSFKAGIEDLKAEASFFDRTATEAAEGLVEIREEFMDEDSVGSVSKSDLEKSGVPRVSEVNSGAGTIDDEEYARIMSRFDELEREELEAEDAEEQEDDRHDEEYARRMSRLDELEREEVEAGDAEEQEDDGHDEDSSNSLGNLSLQPRHTDSDESSFSRDLMQTHLSKPAEKDYVPSILKSSVQSSPKLITEAFTGTIIERADNLKTTSEKQTTISQPSSSQPSKPVSRFKMQRR